MRACEPPETKEWQEIDHMCIQCSLQPILLVPYNKAVMKRRHLTARYSGYCSGRSSDLLHFRTDLNRVTVLSHSQNKFGNISSLFSYLAQRDNQRLRFEALVLNSPNRDLKKVHTVILRIIV